MTVSDARYYQWKNRSDATAPQFEQCSPSLLQLSAHLRAVYGANNLGCHVNRNVIGGTSASSHSWGAAIDEDFATRARTLEVMDWLIANSKELGVNAIHDYEAQRIWYPRDVNGNPAGWHGASLQTGDWIHIETLPESWGDGRSVADKLATAPERKMDDMGLIVKATNGAMYYSTGTLRIPLAAGRDVDIHRFFIGLSGGHTPDVTGISQAEVDAGMIGVDVEAIAAKLNTAAAAIAAAASQAASVLAAANGAKAAALAAQAAAEAALAGVKEDDAAFAALQLRLAELRGVVEETQAAANAAETAALEAKQAAEDVEAGVVDFSKVKLVLSAEGTFEPLGTAEPD